MARCCKSRLMCLLLALQHSSDYIEVWEKYVLDWVPCSIWCHCCIWFAHIPKSLLCFFYYTSVDSSLVLLSVSRIHFLHYWHGYWSLAPRFSSQNRVSIKGRVLCAVCGEFFRPHRLHRWGLLLQMLHVAWSPCAVRGRCHPVIKWHITWWKVTLHWISRIRSCQPWVSFAKTAEPIKMPFGGWLIDIIITSFSTTGLIVVVSLHWLKFTTNFQEDQLNQDWLYHKSVCLKTGTDAGVYSCLRSFPLRTLWHLCTVTKRRWGSWSTSTIVLPNRLMLLNLSTSRSLTMNNECSEVYCIILDHYVVVVYHPW